MCTCIFLLSPLFLAKKLYHAVYLYMYSRNNQKKEQVRKCINQYSPIKAMNQSVHCQQHNGFKLTKNVIRIISCSVYRCP